MFGYQRVPNPGTQVDITRHNDSSLNRVFTPFNLLRLKTLWSEHTLYIAAQLREPFVYGKVFGHNNHTPPYKVGVVVLYVHDSIGAVDTIHLLTPASSYWCRDESWTCFNLQCPPPPCSEYQRLRN